jgi:hypothetical protein
VPHYATPVPRPICPGKHGDTLLCPFLEYFPKPKNAGSQIRVKALLVILEVAFISVILDQSPFKYISF